MRSQIIGNSKDDKLKRKPLKERDTSQSRDLSALKEGPKENKMPQYRPLSSSGKKKDSAKPLRESFEAQHGTNTNG